MTRAVECTGQNELHLVNYPTPVPEENAVLLKIRLAGVCGTDLEGVRGHRTLRFPVIPGHEIVAEVAAMGRDWGQDIAVFGGEGLHVGDRVTISPRIVCGHCYYCQNLPGRPEMCINSRTYGSSIGSGAAPHIFGGWAENIYMLPGSEIVRLPDSLSDDLAVLTEPLSVAVALVGRFKRDTHDWPNIDTTVVIYGAGSIGILMAAAFAASGAKQIVAIDVVDERLRRSTKFGVTHSIDASGDIDAVDAVREMTCGIGADVVIEACGVPKVLGSAIRMLRRGGRLYEVGHLANVGMAEIDPHIVCRNEIEICGHYAYSSQSLAAAAELLARHDFPYETLVHKIRLDDCAVVLDEAFTRMKTKVAFEM